MRFEHNGLTYIILEVKENDERLMLNDETHFGMCNHKKQEIYLMETVNQQQKKRVLMHEVTHMFINTNGMYANTSFNQEQLCEFVAYNSIKILGVVEMYFKDDIETSMSEVKCGKTQRTDE